MSDKETTKKSTKKTATPKKETVKKETKPVKEKKAVAPKKDVKPAKTEKTEKKVAPKKETEKKAKEDKKTTKVSKEKTEKAAEKKASKEKENEEAEVKTPKKTKAEINKEIKENISKDKSNASRKDRNRAEKAALRDAKEDRKAAYSEEQKKAKLSNLVLAIIIFGTLFLMFIIPWGYDYFNKSASIEAFISNSGGPAAFQNIQIDKNKVAAISAEGNKMYVTITDSSKDTEKELKYFKGKTGQEEMEFISAYFLSIIRPDVRGFTASAVCTANVGGKKAAELTIKYSDVEDIMAKRGITPEQIYKQAKESQEEQTQVDENGTPVTETETEE